MKTIKVVLFAIALLIGVSASAQDQKIIFGVKGGLNLSTITGDLNETKMKVGFNVGATLDYAFTPELYLMTGLEYTTKGVKIDVEGDPSLNAAYLQLPIHLGYKFEIAENSKIVVHGGPFVAYGINGKYKEKDPESRVEASVNTFDKMMKRFDFGLGLGAGVEIGKINIGLGYDFGLVNVADIDKTLFGLDDFEIGDISMKTGNAYFTVGYKF